MHRPFFKPAQRVLLAALFAIACAAPAAAQKLAKDQTLRVAVGVDDIRTVDPHVSIGVGEFPLIGPVYEGLLAFPDGEIKNTDLSPALAESWELGADKKTWTFKLRKGVQWHHGYGEFTAEDVRFSIDRVKDKDKGSPFRRTFDVIDSVEVVDPYTVRIRTKEVDPNLPALLVNYQAGYIVSKKAVEAGVDLRTHPIGTGPFQFDSYRPRESMTLVRNDKYWRGKPTLDRIVVQFMSDSSTRELALRSGEVHAIEIPARQDAVDRARKAGLLVDLTSPANMFMLHLNLTKKPFDDLRVRKALAYATNRKDLIAFLGKDIALAEFSPLPSGYVGHTDDLPKYPYDPAKAKALLAEAGFPDGFSANVVVSNNAIYLPPMQVIQEQWKKVGVNLELKVVDHPTYHRLIREDVNPIVIYGAFRYPLTGTLYFEQFFRSSSAIGKPTAVTNFSHYGEVIPGIDKEIEAAKYELDAEKQKALWAEAQRKIMTDVVAIPLVTRKYAMARSKNLDLGFKQKSWSFYLFNEKTRLLAP